MKLGMTLAMRGAVPKLDMNDVLEAERLGFDQVWTGESYSTDAVTPIAWVLAQTTKIRAGTGIFHLVDTRYYHEEFGLSDKPNGSMEALYA